MPTRCPSGVDPPAQPEHPAPRPPEEETADVTTGGFGHSTATDSRGPVRVVGPVGRANHSGGTGGITCSGQGSIADDEPGGFEPFGVGTSALDQFSRRYPTRRRGTRPTLLATAPGGVATGPGRPHSRRTNCGSIPDLVPTIDAQTQWALRCPPAGDSDE